VKRKQTIVVMDNQGNLLVKLKDSAINPLVAHIDGIPLCGFKGDKNYYIKVTVARDWHAKEYADTKQEINLRAKEAFDRILAKQASGDIKILEGNK